MTTRRDDPRPTGVGPAMVVILAHPDDESFAAGGTLAKYAADGVRVALVMATRGEAGIPGRGAEQAAAIREAELRQACTQLGVQELFFLGYEDGHLRDEDEEQAVDRLVAILGRQQPGVVLTFGPDGVSGHPDHITVSRWATMAFDGWQREAAVASHLFYIAPSEATQQGCGVPPPAESVGGPVAFIDVGGHLEQKVRAAQHHASQNPPFHGAAEEAAKKLACHEAFRLARPRQTRNGGGPLADLFSGERLSQPDV
jgi:N-acetylglucosamine malate deacetylase 2